MGLERNARDRFIDSEGNLWLTAYGNRYDHDDVSMPLLAQVLLNWQRDHGVVVFGRRVDRALSKRDGIPVCLTCHHDAEMYSGQPLMALRWLSAPPDTALPAEGATSAPMRVPSHPVRDSL